MSIASGNNQTAPPNTPLTAPLVLKLVDAHGYGVPGVTVNLTDNGAGGTFAANPVVSDPSGTATAQYTTGSKTGKVTITASTTGLKPVNLTVTVH